MAKNDSDNYMVSETGNWNVADQYTKNKIMRPLNMCDYYEDIATFGYESIAEELINYKSPPNDLIRIKAMKRLIRELIRVIDNAKFALKKSGSREKALGYKKNLKTIEKTVSKLVKVTRNQIEKTVTVKISNEDLFDDFLSKISEIKSKVNEPLNQNHLIFTDKEEFDPRAFKDNLKRRMVEQG